MHDVGQILAGSSAGRNSKGKLKVTLCRAHSFTNNQFRAARSGSAEGRPTLRGEHEWTFGLLLASEPAQGPQLVPHNRMDAGGALLDSANVQGGRSEGHLFPAHLMPERASSQHFDLNGRANTVKSSHTARSLRSAESDSAIPITFSEMTARYGPQFN